MCNHTLTQRMAYLKPIDPTFQCFQFEQEAKESPEDRFLYRHVALRRVSRPHRVSARAAITVLDSRRLARRVWSVPPRLPRSATNRSGAAADAGAAGCASGRPRVARRAPRRRPRPPPPRGGHLAPLVRARRTPPANPPPGPSRRPSRPRPQRNGLWHAGRQGRRPAASPHGPAA